MKYFVDVSWTTYATIEIEAKSESEAEDIAMDTPYDEFETNYRDNFQVENVQKEDE